MFSDSPVVASWSLPRLKAAHVALANRGAHHHARRMFVITETDAAAIRAVFSQEGELSAAIELRRRFPGVTDNAKARACARSIAGCTPLPAQLVPGDRCVPARTASHAPGHRAHRELWAEVARYRDADSGQVDTRYAAGEEARRTAHGGVARSVMALEIEAGHYSSPSANAGAIIFGS